jgi:hypothetical protein
MREEGGGDELSNHIDEMFKIVHVSTFNAAVQALNVLFIVL